MPGRLLHILARRVSDESSPPYQKTSLKNRLSPTREATFSEGTTTKVRRNSMDKVKRLSIGHPHPPKEKDKYHKSPKTTPHKAAVLTVFDESPPLVFHGNEQESTGALWSAQLQLDVLEPSITLESFNAKVEAICTTLRPVAKDCPDCSRDVLNLKDFTWTKDAPLKLDIGQHSFPISHLFKGHLPASTESTLVKFEYVLTVTAKTSLGENITGRHVINIKRAVPEKEDHTSSRSFPPTDFMLHATFNRNIYPIGESPFSFRLENLTKKHEGFQIQFRMTSFVWRLEEQHQMISASCPKHAHKHGEGKGVLNQEVRILASDTMTKGWKSDLNNGSYEWELPVAAKKRAHCAVTADNGIHIKHQLIVDLVLREEKAPIGRADHATPTGMAKQCKTQFNLLMTERSGMGISWDEEMPPVYEDIPPSPPHYGSGPSKNVADVPHMLLGESTSTPIVGPRRGLENISESSATAAARRSNSTARGAISTPRVGPRRSHESERVRLTEEDLL